jgi:signal transduction histidine kinase
VRSLRAREFAAIGAAVLVSVGVTLILVFVLVRRSVRHEALQSLTRQVALIAKEDSAATHSSIGKFAQTQQEILARLTLAQAEALLPKSGADQLRAGKLASGSLQVEGRSYFYAASRVQGGQAVVLTRSTRFEASDRRPFEVIFVVAAAIGAALAAVAAYLLAGAVARPITRVARASRSLAAGEPWEPLPVTGPEEVAALAVAFNQLADDLERARQAERSFLLSVSHELKTPLASIRGHGEALLDGVMEVEQGEGVVVGESKRLERLVRDLLDLARLNQRTFTVLPQEVDLARLAGDALDRHQAQAGRVGVELAGDVDGPSPALADPDRVVQVLSNLIENALRSTQAGGSVTVTARAGELTVADTGPGLAPEELPRAFERFYLYQRYATNRAVGTGLGLAIVKELVDAMRGTISVRSAPGTGTTFVVRLPSAPAAVGQDDARAATGSAPSIE